MIVTKQRCRQLQACLLGMDGGRAVVDEDPDWSMYSNAIVEALRPYPDAKIAVVRALMTYEERIDVWTVDTQ